jgi:glycosyltransferase
MEIYHTLKNLRSLKDKYPYVEYIVIDGDSKDGTVQLLEEFNDTIDFWLSEPDEGIYDAMNKGATYSSGNFIQFIGAGDIIKTDNFGKMQQSLKTNIDFDILYGNIYQYLMIGETKYYRTLKSSKPENLLYYMAIMHPSCYVRKDFFFKIGGFNTDFSISADYEFLLKSYLNDARFKYVDSYIVEQAYGGISCESYNTIKQNYSIQNRHIPNYASYFKTNKKLIKLSISKIKKRFAKIIFPRKYYNKLLARNWHVYNL